MKLISWNVNGLRACITKGFFDFVKEADPDILALQETKMQPEQFEGETGAYKVYWNSAEKKGYSGTAVFVKEEPLSVRYGIGIPEHDTEGRVITLETELLLYNRLYAKLAGRPARLEYRMTWEDAFLAYLKSWTGQADHRLRGFERRPPGDRPEKSEN
jgi:exodeoxyribonuclease-3